MIGWEYPPKNSGGLGVACQGIVEHLSDAGQEVLLVLPSGETEKQIKMLRTRLGKFYPVLFLPSNIRAYPESLPEKYAGNLIEDVYLFARDVEEAVRGEVFDLVHVHDWLTVPAGIAVSDHFKKPLIMHVHSTEFDRTAGGEPNYAVSQIEQLGFHEADLIVAVSGYTKKLLISEYHVPQEKIKVVYNGVEKNSMSGQQEADFLGTAPVVLFVGRLTIQKGADNFIRLAKKVLESRSDAIFVIAGDGDMYRYLVEYSAFAEVTGSVLFSGFLRDLDINKLYQRAQVLVMPSVSEPFGLVALEAASWGVPVIVSKTSGVAEVLPSAIQVDYWDSGLAAKHVLDLMTETDKKTKIGEALKIEANQLSWDIAAAKLIKIYQKMRK